MARLRSELLPLAIPVALCLVAWTVILTRPAATARHVPTPRERITLERHPQRPPSPRPAEPAATPSAPAPHAATPAAAENGRAASTPSAAPTEPLGEVTIEGIGISGTSWWGDEDWRADNYRWERWYFYARREWAEWRRVRREAMARRVRSMMDPGNAGELSGDEYSSPVCAVFTSACRSGARRVVPAVASPIAESPATLRRDGHVWKLSNGSVEAAVDPSALCAIVLARRGDDTLPALTVATPHDAPCEVTETMPPDTTVDRGGVAVAITWSGEGWTQRAVLSLSDDATSPELSVTRSERHGSTVATTLTNLTASELTWTFGGRDVSVPAAHTARIGG